MKDFNKKFNFVGRGPGSKSLLNRAWIVKSYFPDFQITNSSTCDDIKIIETAIQNFKQNKEIFCGQSASAFRFMALRASREKGIHILTGSEQLLNRPHQPLFTILRQLGVECFFHKTKKLMIKSYGWIPQGDALVVPSQISSQFASAVLLNGWNLDKDIFISLEGSVVSSRYLDMTISFLKNLGFQIQGQSPEFKILKKQKLSQYTYTAEPDMSCLFTLACFAVLNGKAVFTPWCENSLQPDAVFPDILEKMGVSIEHQNNSLKVNACSLLKGCSLNLSSTPDLFPCLSILCALACNQSHLFGAGHLKYKESNRLSLIAELIQKINRKIEIQDNGLKIQGSTKRENKGTILFDPQEDHRMAMAGALLKFSGFDIEIKNPSCVNKSFPEFWRIIR